MPRKALYENGMIRPETNAGGVTASGDSSKWLPALYELADVMSLALVCLALLLTFGLRTAGVDGSSMLPTLEDKQKLVMSASLPHPERGDIVVISPSLEGYQKPIVKRVIALAGDEIDLVDGYVLLNGQRLDEPYLAPDMPTEPAPESLSSLVYPLRVPEGRVFVMGDNRTGSMDSRRDAVGLIRVDDLLGRVLFRYQPFFVTAPSFRFTFKVD